MTEGHITHMTRLGATQLKPECCTVNRAHLCRNHLSKCEAFREANSEEE
ncbi:16515_t:CDS:2, partial [Racocetra fulgida]